MRNSLERLVLMANQIAANLAHDPDPAVATAEHILAYWDPRMRAMIAAARVTGLSPVAAAAIAQLHAGGKTTNKPGYVNISSA